MTIESMNNEHLVRLRHKRDGYKAELLVNVKNRDRINMTIADLEEKIDDFTKYIEHLEASSPHDPEWEVGDRFVMHGMAPPTYGVIVSMMGRPQGVVIQYDGGHESVIDRERFEKLAVRP